MSDETVVLRTRIMRAFDALLNAALARLRLHYAARISGLLLGGRLDRAAAVAALTNERDAALVELEHSIRESRRRALMAVRKRRYRVRSEPVALEGPRRPQASRPTASRRNRHPHPKP